MLDFLHSLSPLALCLLQVEVSSPNAESENTLTNCNGNDATNSNNSSETGDNETELVEDSEAPTTTQSSKSEPLPATSSDCCSRTNEIKDESGN